MRNFIIVGTQRTGSTLIGSLLNRHPDVFCGWEWTQNLPYLSKLKATERALKGDFSDLEKPDLEHIQKAYLGREVWVGFRRLFRSSDKWLFHPALSPALIADRLEAHIKWFATRPDIHVIHIVRRNNLDWVKSKELSRVTKAFSKQSYPEGLQVTISSREAKRRLVSKAWVDHRLASLAATNPYCKLVYEDVNANRDEERLRLLTFLDCTMEDYDFGDLPIQRQSKGKPEDYIANVEELKAVLNNEGLLWSDA